MLGVDLLDLLGRHRYCPCREPFGDDRGGCEHLGGLQRFDEHRDHHFRGQRLRWRTRFATFDLVCGADRVDAHV